MTFRNKPIKQWDEIDYLEAHIELWTRIRYIWKTMDYIELYDIKEGILQEMTPNINSVNNCYLCDYYLSYDCGNCPLHVDADLQCHPDYYQLACYGYNRDYIDEIIDLARARLNKITGRRNDIGEDSNVK